MLTNAAVKAAAPAERAYKLHDSGGLFLFVTPAGCLSWRLKYRWKGREKLLVLGRFPALSLAEARAARDRARLALRDGRDPGAGAVDLKVDTLEQLARAWHRHNRPGWSAAHAADVLAGLERDIFPALGGRPARRVEPVELLGLLRSIEQRGCVESARRTRQRLSAIFGYGQALGLVERDPAAQLGRAMGKAAPPRPMPALTAIEDCRRLLAACEAVPAQPAVRLASRFLALTAARLAAVRGIRWDEIDLEQRLWTIPAARMKLSRAKKELGRFDHAVPLSAPAIEVLREAANRAGPGPGLVFPGRGGGPIGENAPRELYARAGFAGRHVPHGWRASFSTILNETLGPDWRADIDRALAHAGMGKVEAAYNRAALLDRRREIFERWGAMLTG